MEAITQTADKCLPHCHPHRPPKTPRCRPLSKKVLRRNRLGKQWRVATVRNDPAAQQRMECYKAASRKVQLARAKLIVRQKRIWQRTVLREGGSRSKILWKSFAVPPTPLQAVKSANVVITYPAQITQHIVEHFHSLANQPTSAPAVALPANTTADPALDSLITKSELRRTLSSLRTKKLKGTQPHSK